MSFALGEVGDALSAHSKKSSSVPMAARKRREGAGQSRAAVKHTRTNPDSHQGVRVGGWTWEITCTAVEAAAAAVVAAAGVEVVAASASAGTYPPSLPEIEKHTLEWRIHAARAASEPLGASVGWGSKAALNRALSIPDRNAVAWESSLPPVVVVAVMALAPEAPLATMAVDEEGAAAAEEEVPLRVSCRSLG